MKHAAALPCIGFGRLSFASPVLFHGSDQACWNARMCSVGIFTSRVRLALAGDEKARRMLLLPLSWAVLPSLLFVILQVMNQAAQVGPKFGCFHTS